MGDCNSIACPQMTVEELWLARTILRLVVRRSLLSRSWRRDTAEKAVNKVASYLHLRLPPRPILAGPIFLGFFVADDSPRCGIKLNRAAAAIGDVAKMAKQRARLAHGDL